MWMGKIHPAVCKQIVVSGILGYTVLSFSVFQPWGNRECFWLLQHCDAWGSVWDELNNGP
jgi:hypothetical protein